jgi:hypothetical protein
MLSDLKFKMFYSTASDNIPESFYNLVLSESKYYDRVSGYFSGASLAYYTKGIANLIKNEGKFRLIISHEISEKDYEDICGGYKRRKIIINNMIDRINYSDLNNNQKVNLANLGYLIEIGLVDIKIGFTKSGLFHAKYGLFRDENNNLVYFSGSLNETEAAFKKNYEEITVLTSWKQDSIEIKSKLNDFERLWNNTISDGRIFVKDIDEIVKSELIKFSYGKLIIDNNMLKDNSLIIYYNDGLKLQNNLEETEIDTNQRSIKKLIDKKLFNPESVEFPDKLNHRQVEEIISAFQKYGKRNNLPVIISETVYSFIEDSRFEIDKVAKRGLALKNQDKLFEENFDKFKTIVNSEVYRPLFEIQNRVSFYQAMMKRSANFSVPGAGKTTMVYGTFAYFSSKEINEVSKIVMIGPKNSFLSWKQEFNNVFGNKRKLKVLDIHAKDFSSEMLYKNISQYNLILINYEALPSYKDALRRIIDKSTLLVFDEVHKIKRIDSERSKIAIELSQNTPYRIVLTGTPIPNNYQDIWNFLHILYGIEYDQYFGFSLTKLNNIVGTDIEDINNKLSPFFWRVSKNQLNVPEVNPDTIISLTADSSEQKVIDLLWRKFRHNPFSLYIRLIQLSSNPNLLKDSITDNLYGDFGVDEFECLDGFSESQPVYTNDELQLLDSLQNNSKFEKCVNLSNNLVRDNKKHVIWCIFIDTILKLSDELRKQGIRVATIYGGIPSDEREKIILDFQNNKYDILVTNPHTLAESISLHMVAHDAIYYEYSFNLTHMLQSRDRIHRLGLPEGQETNYYYLMLEGQQNRRSTIDRKIYNRLEEKKNIMIDAIESENISPEYSLDERREILEMMEEEIQKFKLS